MDQDDWFIQREPWHVQQIFFKGLKFSTKLLTADVLCIVELVDNIVSLHLPKSVCSTSEVSN